MVRQSKQALELEQRVSRLESQLAQGSASGSDVLQERLLALEQKLGARFDALAEQFQSLRSCQQELLQVCKSLNPQAEQQTTSTAAVSQVVHQDVQELETAGRPLQKLEISPQALLQEQLHPPQPLEGEAAEEDPGQAGRAKKRRGRKRAPPAEEEEPQREATQRRGRAREDQQPDGGSTPGREKKSKKGKDSGGEAVAETEAKAACPGPSGREAEEAQEGATRACALGQEGPVEGEREVLDAAADALLDDVAVEPNSTQPESVTLPTTEVAHKEALSQEPPAAVPDYMEGQPASPGARRRLHRSTAPRPAALPPHLFHSEEEIRWEWYQSGRQQTFPDWCTELPAPSHPSKCLCLLCTQCRAAGKKKDVEPAAANTSDSGLQECRQLPSATSPAIEGDTGSLAPQSPATQPGHEASSSLPEPALSDGKGPGESQEAADRPASVLSPRKKRLRRLPSGEAQLRVREESQVSTPSGPPDLQSTSLPNSPASACLSEGKGELDLVADAFLDDLAGGEEEQDQFTQKRPLDDSVWPEQQVEETQEPQQSQPPGSVPPELGLNSRRRSRSSSCPKAHYMVSHNTQAEPEQDDQQPAQKKRPRNDCDTPVQWEGDTQDGHNQSALKRLSPVVSEPVQQELPLQQENYDASAQARPRVDCDRPEQQEEETQEKPEPSGFLSEDELRWAWYWAGRVPPFLEWCAAQPRSCRSAKCLCLLCKAARSVQTRPEETRTTVSEAPKLQGPAEELVPPTTTLPSQTLADSPAPERSIAQAVSHEQEESTVQLDAPAASHQASPILTAQDEPAAQQDVPQSALATVGATPPSPPNYAVVQAEAGEALRGRRKKQEWYKQRYGQASEANAAVQRQPQIVKRPPKRQGRRQEGGAQRWPTFVPLPHYVPAGGKLSAVQAAPSRSPTRSSCAPPSPVDDLLPPL